MFTVHERLRFVDEIGVVVTLYYPTKGPSEVFCDAWRIPLDCNDAIVLVFDSIIDHIASLKCAQPHSHLGIHVVTVIRAIAACAYVIIQDGLATRTTPGGER